MILADLLKHHFASIREPRIVGMAREPIADELSAAQRPFRIEIRTAAPSRPAMATPRIDRLLQFPHVGELAAERARPAFPRRSNHSLPQISLVAAGASGFLILTRAGGGCAAYSHEHRRQ